MKPPMNPAVCDNRECANETSDWKKDGWIVSSGETIRGKFTIHDHRYTAGHYCSWNCFCKEPVQDL